MNALMLGYDTETNGFVNNREPASHPSQPQLVQFAALLFDADTGKEYQSVNFIVKPDCDDKGHPLWTIPKSAADVHGITTDMAMALGVPLRLAVAAFTNMRAVATATVAHNIGFDTVVLEAALHRTGAKPAHPGPSMHYCTMRAGTDVCKLPGTVRMKASGRDGYKAPKLIELHQVLFGVGFEGAHDALADVRACVRSFLELRKRGVQFVSG